MSHLLVLKLASYSGEPLDSSENCLLYRNSVKARCGEMEYEIDTTGLRERSTTPLAGKGDSTPRERGGYL